MIKLGRNIANTLHAGALAVATAFTPACTEVKPKIIQHAAAQVDTFVRSAQKAATREIKPESIRQTLNIADSEILRNFVIQNQENLSDAYGVKGLENTYAAAERIYAPHTPANPVKLIEAAKPTITVKTETPSLADLVRQSLGVKGRAGTALVKPASPEYPGLKALGKQDLNRPGLGSRREQFSNIPRPNAPGKSEYTPGANPKLGTYEERVGSGKRF